MRMARYRALNDGSQATEPGIRISQIVVELTSRYSGGLAHITLCYGWTFERLKHGTNNIAVTVSDSGTETKGDHLCLFGWLRWK